MTGMRPLLQTVFGVSRQTLTSMNLRAFSTTSLVNVSALNFWSSSNSGPAHETTVSQTLTNSSSRLFGWSVHLVQPGKLEKYISAQEGVANWVSGRVGGLELMGSWRMLSGDLDTCCHLWKFNNNEEDVDQLLDLQASKEYAEATAKVSSTLRSQSHMYRMGFSFWPECTTRPAGKNGKKNVYEIRDYQLSPGAMIEWGRYWSKAVAVRHPHHKHEMFAASFSQAPELYNVQHMFVYEGMEERREARNKVWVDSGETFQECVSGSIGLVVQQKSLLLTPLPFSPTL